MTNNKQQTKIKSLSWQDHAGEYGYLESGGVPLALDGRGALRGRYRHWPRLHLGAGQVNTALHLASA